MLTKVKWIVEDEMENAIVWQDILECAQFNKSDGESLDVLGEFLNLEAVNG